MQFFLKTSRIEDAPATDDVLGQQILSRLRHEGRKVTEVFVLHTNGGIDRYQERTRRKLGSNAVASRTWLCESAEGGEWGNGRYIPDPSEAISEAGDDVAAIVIVLSGAEGVTDAVVEQLQNLRATA